MTDGPRDSLEATARARVGTSVGRYRLERVLGVGGMAEVFLAVDPEGRRAALKVLHADLADVEEIRKRFLRESLIGSALGGGKPLPGIVRVFEAGEAPDGTAYIAMEALEGETLFERMNRVPGPMPVEDALAMADQVLEVLAVAHEQGIVHRDLKPENLFVVAGGVTKMLDFGIARVMDAVKGMRGLPEKTATRTGVIMGTAAYMAPEQATGLVTEVDGRTDLYALGATLFRLLSGRFVHERASGTQLVIAAATEQAPALASVAPHAPAAVCAIVDKALAFSKHDRYPTARAMLADVRAARSALAALQGALVLPQRPEPTRAMGTPSALAHGDHAHAGGPLSAAKPTLVDEAPPFSRAGPTSFDPDSLAGLPPRSLAHLAAPGPIRVNHAPAHDGPRSAHLPAQPDSLAGPPSGAFRPNSTAPDRPSLDRNSLDRASFDRSSLDRSSLDRSSLDRASLERPARTLPDAQGPMPPWKIALVVGAVALGIGVIVGVVLAALR